MAKTNFGAGSYLTPTFCNTMYYTGGGHVHDGDTTTDGHAQKINLSTCAIGRCIVNNLTLPGYISGMTLSMGAALSTTCYIAAGTVSCENAAGTASVLVSASAGTKKLAQIFVAGTGNNGVPGTVPIVNETWYHVFLLVSADGTTCDWGFDNVITAANLLTSSGATYYRRLGSVFWTLAGTNHIAPFLQIGDMFLLDRKIGTDTGMHTQSVTSSDLLEHTVTLHRCPLGLPIKLHLSVEPGMSAVTAKFVRLANGYDVPTEADVLYNVQLDTKTTDSNSPAGYFQRYPVVMMSNSSSQIRFSLSEAIYTPISFCVRMFEDTRGKL
jgi:hypothetical protein